MFIDPPYKSKIHDFFGASAPLLGFGSMSYQLEQAGHRSEILDCPTLGLSRSDATKVVGQIDPDVVGITSTTPSFDEAYKLAKDIKTLKPECIIVMGGPHVSFEDHAALQHPYVDIVVRGKGEFTLRELVTCLERGASLSGVLGITYRTQGVPQRNPDRPARAVVRRCVERP